MTEDISTTEMRACIAVGQTLSFTEAGKQTECVKSQVSKYVGSYENKLGFPVFGRTTRQVHPTVPGRNLLPSIRAAIRYWDKQVARARAVAHDTEGCKLKEDVVDLQLSQIARLIAVTETRSATKAAAELHVSQSYISQLVIRFEDRLGFQLFERSTWKGFQPTPAGRIFLSSARAFLQFCNDRHQWSQMQAAKRTESTRKATRAYLKMLEDRDKEAQGQRNKDLRKRLALLLND